LDGRKILAIMAPEILRHDFCRNYLSGLVVKVSLRRTFLAACRNILLSNKIFKGWHFCTTVALRPGERKYRQS
jgi:hypothetical protein